MESAESLAVRSVPQTVPKARLRSAHRSLLTQIKQGKYLLLMLALPVILVAIFDYGPMYGLQIAFKDYQIPLGIWGSPWVGLKHFRRFFTNPASLRVLKNTIEISLLRLLCGFPMPIILALLINEMADGVFKRVTQSLSYLPHFISWIIIAALVNYTLSPSQGIVNLAIKALGGEPIYFMIEPKWFRPVLILSGIWKEIGWGSVIYLAALSGVDPTLHEAAIMDGASRLQRIRYVNLPSIAPVVTITLILNMGGIMNAGFDQIFNMYNARVFAVSDIIDTFVYRVGLVDMSFSYSAAVGMFKSLVGLILIVTVNAITRRISGKGTTLW